MELEQQIQTLIDEAPPEDNLAPAIRAIAPVFHAFAGRLPHHQYYLVQNLEGSWLTTTLQSREDASTTKTVIYAFSSLEAATQSIAAQRDASLMVLPVPIIHILFQMMAMYVGVDGAVFLESPGSQPQGIEVRRVDLLQAVQLQLQRSHLATHIA